MTPVIRDFFYQPMLYDLLEIENDMVEYNLEDKTGKSVHKKAVLQDNDDLFEKYKYKHIAEVF